MRRRGPHNGRERFILACCPFDPAHIGSTDAAIFAAANGQLGFLCQHSGCDGRGWKELRELFEPESSRHTAVRQGQPEPPSDDEIDVTELDLPTLTARAIEALDRWNNPPILFVHDHDGSLGRIDVGEKTGQRRVRAATVPIIRKAMSDSITYVRHRQDERVMVSPPKDLVENVIASERFPFPILRGIARAPFFTAAGKMVRAPGYDPASGMFLAIDAGLVIPDVPEHPTTEQVAQAVADIRDVVCDFPFDGDASIAHFYGAMILPSVITMIRGATPFHIFGAPAPRSGKTYLGKIAATPAVGEIGAEILPRSSPKSHEPDAETRKKIIAILKAGKTVQLFDNIEGDVDSDSLKSVLTSRLVSGRLLGTNDDPDYVNNTTWLGTANNAKFSAELRERSVSIRIDAEMERPGARDDFKHKNVVQHALENRGNLIAAVLTIVQAWIAAGRPQPDIPPPAFGTYEAWSEVIGGILAFAEIPGFLANREEFDDQSASDDEDAFRTFVLAWSERREVTYGEHGEPIRGAAIAPATHVKSADLVPLAAELKIIDSATSDRAQLTKLGILLRKHLGQVAGDYQIAHDKADRKWFLRPPAPKMRPHHRRSQAGNTDEHSVSATSATSATSGEHTTLYARTRAHGYTRTHAHAESDMEIGRKVAEVAETSTSGDLCEPAPIPDPGESADDEHGEFFF